MTDTCTPEHCTQADVCMCWRTHTPTTCPAHHLAHTGDGICGADTTCPTCDCCPDHWLENCQCEDRKCGCYDTH